MLLIRNGGFEGMSYEITAEETLIGRNPTTDITLLGPVTYKRLQVANGDLDPSLNPDARYFVEGQYVAPDDAAAGNGLNNASHREVQVIGTNLVTTGATLWRARFPGKGLGPSHISPLIAGGRLYFGQDDGDFHVIDGLIVHAHLTRDPNRPFRQSS